MPLTNEYLSIWELGHRLAGEDPHRWRPFGLPLEVKDAVRLLVHEILHAHLESTLIMEKWQEGVDTDPDMHIRHHLPAIERCINLNQCEKKLLKSVGIERWDFYDWCKRSGYPPPDFWFAVEYHWREDPEDAQTKDDGSGGAQPEVLSPERLKPSSRARVACQEIAKAIWKENPALTIAEMINRDEITRLGGGGHFDEKTRRNWLSQVAPLEVRERRGRPSKSGKVEPEQ